MTTETITLGGGCFWCTEAVFTRVRGVLDVESGYCNGQVVQPSYEQVCTGTTGHAEVVQLVFDPQVVSLESLLEVFFATHDPTTLNRQGNDVGTQYRSGVYAQDDTQLARVRSWLSALKAEWPLHAPPVVTELALRSDYWPAEDYHQDYFEQHPNQGYCAFVVGPKVEKFRHSFQRLLRDGA